LLVAQKKFDELAGISSEYISAKIQNPNLILTAASILSSLDSVELKKEGIKLFEHVISLSPALTDARLNLASAYYKVGDADKAEKIYKEFLEQFPNDVRCLNDLAWILQEHYKRYSEALALADKGLSFAPDNLHLLDTRGTILSNLPDRLNDAKSDFERLAGLSSQDQRQKAMAYLQLGRICNKLKEIAQARQHLENALEIDRQMDVFTAEERTEINNMLQKSGAQAVNR
jgi:tetratricopeptide (TPR) repeat protein